MAEAALPAASYLAEVCSAGVTLIHVVEERPPREIHGEHHLSGTDEAAEYLRAAAGRFFKDTAKVTVHVHAELAGNVARKIVEHQAEFDHDLIVMCTHGRSGMSDLIFGTIAQNVIAHGTVPVLIVRPSSDPEASFSASPMLVPLDGTRAHEAGLEIARDLAERIGGVVRLLMVIPTFATMKGTRAAPSKFLPGTTDRMLDMAAEEAERYLRDTRALLAKPGVTIDAEIDRGDPARVIAKAASARGSRLIVLGTHGKAGIDALGEGSVASTVCAQTATPVLLIPLSPKEP